MSTEKTDVLENTENTGTAVTETASEAETAAEVYTVHDLNTAAEEQQNPAEDIREGTAVVDVAENAAPDEEAALQEEPAVQDEGSGNTIRKTVRTGESAAEGSAAEPDESDVSAKTAVINKPAESEEAGTDGSGPEEAGPDEGGPEESGTDEQEPTEEEEGEAPEKDPEIEAIKEKIRERKREKKRKARRRRTLFWTTFITIAVVLGGFLFSISGFFTVDSIEVRGNSHFTAEEIINIGHAVPGHNLIYEPDSKNITEYLEQNPYIKSAEVSRKLPSTLVITVNERAEAICFTYDDDYLIMDDEGILLKKTRTEPKITMVKGFVVTRLRLGDTVGTENPQMFSKLLRLMRTMKAADLYFVTVDMTSYMEDMSVRAYIYDKLVVKASYEDLITNLKNGRLHKIVETLFKDDVKRGTITLSGDGEASFEPGI